MVQNYEMAGDVSDALRLLKEWGGRARIIAGGTALVLDLQKGRTEADCIVDISRIAALKEIKTADGKLAIGAAVTHSEAAADPRIRAYAHALAKASGCVGARQIRNCSTVAGNVIIAQSAADSSVALAALGAEAEVQSAAGAELFPVEALYAGPGKSKVDSTASVMTRIFVPMARKGEGSGYARLQKRKALALPTICVGAFLRADDGIVKACRIVMAPAGPGPVHAAAAEKFLIGKKADKETFREAGKLALQDANPTDSVITGSRSYRLEVLPLMIERALTEALEDSKQEKKEAEQA